MTVSRRLRSARHDIYTELVTRTAKDELEVENLEDELEYPFDTNYQLFAAGLTLGFLRGEKREESKGNYDQGYIQVNRIGGGGDNEFRQGIEFLYELIAVEYPELEEDEVWEEVLQYADAGVEVIYQDMDIKDEFDMLGFLQEAKSAWEGRLEEFIAYQQESSK